LGFDASLFFLLKAVYNCCRRLSTNDNPLGSNKVSVKYTELNNISERTSAPLDEVTPLPT
jgi:hypothetical protein